MTIPSSAAIPRPDHIAIVVMENHAYEQIIGSSSAPYINGLANQNALMSQSFAIGHPSEPNYLELWSGSNQGITDDSCPHTHTTLSLGTALLNAGLTVAGYNESMPSDGYTGCSSGGYARKHNPLADWTATADGAHTKTFNAWPTDFATLPTVSLVIPNLCNDMHDCSIANGDGWLRTHWDPYVQWAKTHNSLAILTFDEDDDAHGNHIVTVFAGQGIAPGHYPERVNHYNILRTIEDFYGLPHSGNAATVAPITDIWAGAAGPSPSPSPAPNPPPSPSPSPTPTASPSPGQAAPQLVQASGASESAPATTLTATFGRPSSRGGLLVLTASMYADKTNNILSVVDSSNNTWKRIGAYSVARHSSDGEMWYSANTSPVTAVRVTVAQPATIAMTVEEFAGVTATNPVGAFVGTADKSTAADSGAVGVPTPTYLAVGFVAGHTLNQVITVTASGYITHPQQTSSGGPNRAATLISGFKLLGTASSERFTGTFPRAMYWASGVALFAVAPSSPIPAPAQSPTPPPSPSANPSPSTSPTPSSAPAPSPAPSTSCNLTPPIRAAFYYPWYPENWTQGGIYPATRYHPSAGFYSLDGAGGLQLYRQQIASMQYAHIRAGIASWWGQGTLTDGRISQLLSAAHGTGFCWTLYYEPSLTATRAASDLAYIANHYASDPSFLHVNGKPVIFVYSRAVASCADAATWKSVNHGFYLNLQVFGGYTGCPAQPDGWHQYGPASAEDHQAGYSFSISPGFNKYSEPSARLSRDPARWTANVAHMVNSHEPWQLITTFNEWMEGTSVEDATEWQSASGQGVYMDTLHRY